MPAIRYSFAAENDRGEATLFEALGGMAFDKGGAQVFTLLQVPEIFQRQYSLPGLFEICTDNHDVTLGIDAQSLLPTVVAQLDNIVVGLSRLSGRYVAWSTGERKDTDRMYYQKDLPVHHSPDGSSPASQDGCSNSSNNSFPGLTGIFQLGREGTQGADECLSNYLFRPEAGSILAESAVSTHHVPLADVKYLNINPQLVNYSLLNNKLSVTSDPVLSETLNGPTTDCNVVTSHKNMFGGWPRRADYVPA